MNRSAQSGSFSIWKALVVVALVVEVIVVLVLISGRSDVTVSDPESVAATSEDGRFEDADGQYSFDYPDDWEIDQEDAVTKLLSPGNDIAIAVGPAPPGDVLASSDQLVEGVSDRYAKAQTKSRELTRVGGNLGLTVTGTAVNEFGVRVRFAIVTVEGTNANNYAITSFAAGVEGDAADRALAQVVENFEIAES